MAREARALRRTGLSLGVALLAAAFPAAAGAHTSLLRTEPPPRSVVAQAPRQIVLHFDQQVTPVPKKTDITGPSGSSVLAGPPSTSPTDVRAIVLPLEAGLKDGDYTVRWNVLSADGHLIRGIFAIGVGANRPPPAVATAQGSNLDSGFLVARFCYFIGLLTLLGVAVYRVLVFAPALRSMPPQRRAEVEEVERVEGGVLIFAAVALLVVGGWAAVIWQATEVSGVSFWAPLTGVAPVANLLDSNRFGREFGRGLNMALLFVALLALRYVLKRWRPVGYGLAAAAALAGGWALAAPALAGHAGDPGRSALAVAVDTLHLTGSAVWLGGLAHLFLLTPAATAVLAPVERARVRREIAERFSRLALASVLVIAASGLGRALWEVGAVSQVWTTGYGRTLMIKSGLLGILVVLGYRNRHALARFPELRRRVGRELIVLVPLVAAVALLTDLPPAKTRSATAGAVSTAPRPSGVATVRLGAGGQLTLWPAERGANAFVARLPTSAPSGSLILQPRLGNAAVVVLERYSAGLYAGIANRLPAGTIAAKAAAGGRTWPGTITIGPGLPSQPAPAPAGIGPVTIERAKGLTLRLRRSAGTRARLVLLGPDGTGVAAALVAVNGRLAPPCAGVPAGCYQLVVPRGLARLQLSIERAGKPGLSLTVELRAPEP